MENTLTIYLDDGDERRRRRRRRIAAAIIAGGVLAALAKGTPEAGRDRKPPRPDPPPQIVTIIVSDGPIGPQQPKLPPLPLPPDDPIMGTPPPLQPPDDPVVRTPPPSRPDKVEKKRDGTLRVDERDDRADVTLYDHVTELPPGPPGEPLPPVAAPAPPRVLCFQPQSLSFVTPGTRWVTLTNPESTPLHVSRIRLVRNGADATGYTVDASACVGVLRPNGKCRLAVTAGVPAMRLHETVQIAIDAVDPATKEPRAVHRAAGCGR